MRIRSPSSYLAESLPDVLTSLVRGITYIPARITVAREESTCTLRADLVFSRVDNIRYTMTESLLRSGRGADVAFLIARPLAEFAERFEEGRTGIRDLVDQ